MFIVVYTKIIIDHDDEPFLREDQIIICCSHSKTDFDRKSDLDHNVNFVGLQL